MTDENIHSDQSQQRKIAALARQLKEQSISVDEYLSESEWAQFLEKQEAHGAAEDGAYQAVHRSSVRRSKIRKASIYTGFILLVAGIAGYIVMNNVRRESAPALAWSHRNVSPNVEKITLPDNSSILLYPNSIISYNTDFQENDRQIQLTGRSEFTVTQQSEKPFVVYCRNVATKVLGTRFLVNGDDEHVSIHLYEGKVLAQGLRDSSVQYLLKPGETVTYLEPEDRFVVEGVANAPATTTIVRTPAKPVVKESPQTKKSLLEFQNEQLASIFDYLAEKYAVEIRYPTDQALSTNVLLSIDAAQPVEKILYNICRANGLKLINTGDSVFTITR